MNRRVHPGHLGFRLRLGLHPIAVEEAGRRPEPGDPRQPGALLLSRRADALGQIRVSLWGARRDVVELGIWALVARRPESLGRRTLNQAPCGWTDSQEGDRTRTAGCPVPLEPRRRLIDAPRLFFDWRLMSPGGHWEKHGSSAVLAAENDFER